MCTVLYTLVRWKGQHVVCAWAHPIFTYGVLICILIIVFPSFHRFKELKRINPDEREGSPHM